MEIRQLKRFLAVVEHGSLAAAAPRIGLTQQALGASLAGLERELGLVLIDRRPGGQMALTAYGAMLVRHAQALLSAEARAVRELHDLKEARGGSVALGIGETFSPELVAAAVQSFHAVRPNVELTLIEDYSEALLERLLEAKLDFVAGADIGTSDQGIIRFPLYAADDVVIARANHPLAGRKGLTIADLQGFTWLAPFSRPADAEAIRDSFRKAGLEPPSRFVWTDARTVGTHLLRMDDYLFMTSPAMLNATAPLASEGLTQLDVEAPAVERRAGLLFTALTHLNPPAMLLMEGIREAAHRSLASLGFARALNADRRIAQI